MGKNKYKKILMFTYGDWNHASSRIRALAYIPALEGKGEWTVKHCPRAPDKKNGVIHKITFALLKRYYAFKRSWLIFFYNWDIVFAQRIFLSPLLLYLIRQRRIPLIYDFDDAVYLPNKRSLKQTAQMVQNADAVIVASYELAEFCSSLKKTATYIPSPIDCDRIKSKEWDPDNPSNIVTIGWVGSSWTEKYLEEVAEALRRVFKENFFRLLLIGASEQFSLSGIKIETIPWSYQIEADLLHKVDIGIMPLPMDEWSKGKGGYKLYQYMAAGLPVIASPVGINKTIVEHGKTGFLANTVEEWTSYFMLLGKDAHLRYAMGKAGRRKAESNYSYTICYEKLDNILKEAIKKRN